MRIEWGAWGAVGDGSGVWCIGDFSSVHPEERKILEREYHVWRVVGYVGRCSPPVVR